MKQNDVFLYNFFCSSPLLEEEWRIILEYMKEQDMLECTPDRSAPTFNPAKHGNLCWELKQLYTAITRARNRLQILENAVELSCPLFDYWKKLSCVHARQLDDSLVMAIQTTSTQKEWRCLGIKLYCEGLYDKAEMCFAKARDVHRGTWAKASGLRAAAGHVRALQSDAARESIKKAAKLFGEIGRLDSVVQCLIEAEEYERAGNFFMKGSRKEDADLCFSLAASNKCAVEAYPGNLVEAEGTSRMKRSILREVDLLETADRYKDVSASTPEDRPVTNAEDGKSSQEKLAYPSLPEEPKGDKILLCRVGLRLPDGHRVQRNFLRSDPIQLLWSFCCSIVKEAETRPFHLANAIPGVSKSLEYDSKLTFEESGLANSMISMTWD